MFVIDGIAYAGKPKEPVKITSARPLDALYLLVAFATGEKRIYDATPLLRYPAYQPLKDRSVFDKICVDHGILTWNGGEIDIAPETVYENSYPYEEPKQA
jgi:hypothetical protein